MRERHDRNERGWGYDEDAREQRPGYGPNQRQGTGPREAGARGEPRGATPGLSHGAGGWDEDPRARDQRGGEYERQWQGTGSRGWGGHSGESGAAETNWAGRYGEDQYGGGAYYGAGFHNGEPLGLAALASRAGRRFREVAEDTRAAFRQAEHGGRGPAGYGDFSGAQHFREHGGYGREASGRYAQGGFRGSAEQGMPHDHGYGGGTYGENTHGDFSERREWSERPGFYGRGPKGYARSDERIREDISDRLSDDHYVDASEITVLVRDGEVTLEGSVETRSMKRRAENIADAVRGVKDVHNHLRTTRSLLGQVADKITGRDAAQSPASSENPAARVPPAGVVAGSSASTAGLAGMNGRNGTGS